MNGNRKSATWFAALRRDRMLFAVAATLVLLTHLFQPFAMAGAAGQDVICSMASPIERADGGTSQDKAADHCPGCVGGPCAILAAPFKALPVSELAFPALPETEGEIVHPDRAELPAGRLGQPPPAIRAPPSFV